MAGAAAVLYSQLAAVRGACAASSSSFAGRSCGSAALRAGRQQQQQRVQHSRRHMAIVAAAANKNTEYVIVGGGNAAGYAARAFVENNQANGKLCIVAAEEVAPYERPALTKAYLFPPESKPARLPGFHTCVGGGGERQTPEWYKEKGIEVLYGTEVVQLDTTNRTLTTANGDVIDYGALILATGSIASRLPDKIGGNLPGVHYIRGVKDADCLVEAFGKAENIVVVGGGYIGMEIVFPDKHLMPRIFTPTIAAHYEKFFESKGEISLTRIVGGGEGGAVTAVELSDGSTIPADLVVVGVGAKPATTPFKDSGLEFSEDGGIKVDGQLRTSVPGVFAVGDVAHFPVKVLGTTQRVEHVDHARKSATHAVNALLQSKSDIYDYMPFFYSRVFEHPGSDRKIWWQFYGANEGDIVEVGSFDPKIAAFWVKDGRVVGAFLESGSPEEFGLLPKIARARPEVSVDEIKAAKTVEEALELVSKAGAKVGAV
eukprot:jgi/Chlat1/5605/Chrsp369S00414